MSTDLSTPSHPSAPMPIPQSARSGAMLAHFIYKYGLMVVLLLMILFFTVTQPFFGTFSNVMFILQASAVVAVVGLGCTFSMTVGGFDLSVGSTMSLVVMVAAGAMVIFNLNGPCAILLGLGAGVLVGVLNSLLIVYARIPDLIATLATMFLVNGVTLLAVNGQSIATGMMFNGKMTTGTFSPVFKWLGFSSVLGVHSSAIIAAAVFFVIFVILNLTKWGRIFYAIGGNPVAAAAVGINVRRYRILAYLLSGFFAAIAGLILLGLSNRADVDVGSAYLLQAVASALIGCAVLGANKPNAFGTVIGAVFVAILINGLTMFNFPYYAQTFVQGVLLAAALLMSYTLGPKRRH